MKKINKKATRLIITFPAFLKSQLEETAEKYGCSQALILRTAFIRFKESTK
jgi:hypothetical protein